MTLKEATELLLAGGVESASYDAREIFRRFVDAPILSDTDCQSEELIDMVMRRSRREPLQYILGEVGFYREVYRVNPCCLIPRSDTEILVDYAVKNLPDGACFADLCTGSGCIAISTLKNTKNTTAIAIDIDGGALALAEENARLNGVSHRLVLRQMDLMKDAPCERLFAVLSNPPYVSEADYKGLAEEIYHEPPHAFVGGVDGGDFYRHMTPIYRELISPDGFIAYEIGADQGELLRAIARENNMSVKILKDLSSLDRVAVLKRLD